MIDLIKLYDEQLTKESEEYRKKNPKTDDLYRASSSGMCARKIFFESLEKADKSEEPEAKGTRIMRLGTVMHEEVQSMLIKAFEDKDRE